MNPADEPSRDAMNPVSEARRGGRPGPALRLALVRIGWICLMLAIIFLLFRIWMGRAPADILVLALPAAVFILASFFEALWGARE